MKQKGIVLSLMLGLGLCTAWSQEPVKLTVGFEVGSGFVTGDLNPNWNVRQDVGNYNYGYGYSNSLSSEMTMAVIGIRPEISFFKGMFAVSSGLRYTRMNSTMSKGSNSKSSYFFLKDNVNTANTEYYKVKEIWEDNDYLGIPLEVTFLPFQYDQVGFYFKAGVEMNFRINSKRDIAFLNPDMEIYQQEFFDHVGITPNVLYSTFYTSVGMRMGKKNKTKYNFELLLPSTFLTKNNSSLVVPQMYSGFKFSVQLLVSKTGISKPKTNDTY